MPINPVHVALMHNGKILVVSGSGNYPPNTSYAAAVWDPTTSTVTTIPVGWDMFCNGMSVLLDGRVMIAGGTLQYDPFFGWQRTTIYDPATGNFVDMQDMAHGRWYPTLTELGDGRVMIFSGLDETGSTNSRVEIYKTGVGWGTPLSSSWTPPLYPRMHLLPSGKVFYSSPGPQSREFDPAAGTWSSVLATTVYGNDRTYGSSVLLPLTPANGYTPKVMIFGGGNPSTATTEIIDLSATSPKWASGPSMSQPRIEMDATILPNGKVLAIGGSLNDEDTSTASLNADLYNPATNTMGSGGANAFARLYHSVSLLLPDATVWVAGGNPARGTYEEHVEIYSPPYLFNPDGTLATRPSITSVSPSVVGYGTSFQLQTPDAASIAQVVLVKAGYSTHAFDMDQRLVGLNFTTASGALTVTGPPNGNVAPPGYYLLFVLNTAGVPSVAKFVQVSAAPTDVPPSGTITSPSSTVALPPGGSVNFAGAGTAPSGSISSYSWVFRGGSPGSSTVQNPGAVTFPTSGTYVASLTVTDNSGITDPSPQTRTIVVTTAPPPTVSAASPNAGPQGQTNLRVNLTGTNFQTNPTCSFGNGITINSCVYNSATQVTANISILGSAVVGKRDIIVTNSDGQNGTLAGGFSILQGSGNPAPTLISASPNSGTQGQNNINIVLLGTNFLPNPLCDFDSDQGLATVSCTFISATQINAVVSLAANAVLGGHNIVVTDSDGQSATLVNGFTVTAGVGGTNINLSGGFSTGSMVLNGNAVLNGTKLQITDSNPAGYEASSAWYPSPVSVANFTTDFSLQITGVEPTADGMAFVIQNTTTAALGPLGGGLGYGPDTPGGTGGIPKSIAIKFDLYDNVGEGTDSTGIYINGASPTTPAVDLTTTGINLHSGDVFHVHITYDGTNLVMTITDTSTNATFTQTWPINIPNTIGGTTAYVGFTGGDGGLTAIQDVLSWTMVGSGASVTATPTFSLAGGTYLGPQTVTLSDATTGAAIFYTLDGTTPGTSVGGSTLQYGTSLNVSSSETIKAIATASGLAASSVSTSAYTIESQVATPTFSPGAGTYTSAQTVTISTTTPGATIYFTTDGTTPSTSSTQYTQQIQVSTNQTLEAIAVESGYFNSGVATGTYIISVPAAATPVISPASGTYTTLQTVTIGDSTAGAVIHYTTDGTTPTTASAVYSSSFQISATTTVKAIAAAPGFNNSGVATSTITINLPTAATPLISPAAGTYTTPQTISITDTTTGAVIHYTTNGTTPTSASAVYVGSFQISATTTVKALAIAPGFKNSAVASSAFTINLPTAKTPVISPAAGTYTTPQTVSITDATTGAVIHYTTDGTTPTSASAVYGGSLQISATTTVKALAIAPGFKNSAVASSAFTINLPTTATPVITPATGTFTSTQSVNITDTTAGAKIYYTTDGTTPTTSSTLFGTSFTANGTTTVKAIAVASGFNTSAVATSVITINLPAATPLISPATGTYTTPQTVTISDASAGVTIYYTTDGTTPTTSSAIYSTSFTVNATATVKAMASGGGFSASTVAMSVLTINIPITETPVISPAGGAYSTPQTVTITDTTPGAAIYFTTNGSTPTTASTLYSGSLTISSTSTVKAIAAAGGLANSGIASASYSIGLTTQVNLTSGFATANIIYNGSAGSNGTRLHLTDGADYAYENGSGWFPTQVGIQQFTTDFTFQQSTPDADGMTFTIQNAGTSALGPSGGGLGYGPDTPGGTPGVGKSVAIKFDLFDNDGEGPNSTGLYLNGASPTVPAVTLGGGVDLHTGHIFQVHMAYDGTTLTMTITDTTNTADTFTVSWPVDIPGTVGAGKAYVGFTGGTGGLLAAQEVVAWTFAGAGN
jgi:hypothetical protein